MSNKVINLTLPVVEQELNALLEIYPHKLHQVELTNSDLRQELLAYVLNRIPNYYVTQNNLSSQKSSPMLATLEQQQQIKTLIFQGINYLTTVKYKTPKCA